jgi:hypothetical protein
VGYDISMGEFHMRRLSKIKTGSALVAFLLSFAIAVPVWSDTLILRTGTTLSGTLTDANTNTIMFTDRRGYGHRYSADEVEAVQFGDAPYHSDKAPDQDNRPADDHHEVARNDNNQTDRDEDSRAYDQASMERVMLPAGTEIALLAKQRIDSKEVVQGQTFLAQINEDVRENDGSIAIPRGSGARLVTRRVEGNGDITLDVQSIEVEGWRYRVSTADQELDHRDGVGANKRTEQFVGGGAVFGSIVGALAAAGSGACAQTVTRGKEVHVPAETVIRFRLDRPLRLHLWS